MLNAPLREFVLAHIESEPHEMKRGSRSENTALWPSESVKNISMILIVHSADDRVNVSEYVVIFYIVFCPISITPNC